MFMNVKRYQSFWLTHNNFQIIEVPGDIHYLFVGASVDRIVAASSEVAKLCVLSTGETLATIEPQDTVDDVTMSKRCVAVRGEALTAISLTNLVSNSVEVYDTVTGKSIFRTPCSTHSLCCALDTPLLFVGISDSVFMTVKVSTLCLLFLLIFLRCTMCSRVSWFLHLHTRVFHLLYNLELPEKIA